MFRDDPGKRTAPTKGAEEPPGVGYSKDGTADRYQGGAVDESALAGAASNPRSS